MQPGDVMQDLPYHSLGKAPRGKGLRGSAAVRKRPPGRSGREGKRAWGGAEEFRGKAVGRAREVFFWGGGGWLAREEEEEEAAAEERRWRSPGEGSGREISTGTAGRRAGGGLGEAASRRTDWRSAWQRSPPGSGPGRPLTTLPRRSASGRGSHDTPAPLTRLCPKRNFESRSEKERWVRVGELNGTVP